MAPAEQQALDYLRNKQDKDLATLLRSQPASANAAHITLDKLAQACMPTSFISLLQLSLVSQQNDDLSEESPRLALHRLVSDFTDQNSAFVFEVLTALQSAGLSLNQASEDKDTPLHLAARSGHLQLCKELVNHGADPLARNSKNR